MKFILVLIITLFFSPSEQKVILYSESKALKWSDFRIVNQLGDAAAETSTEVSYTFENTDGHITVKVYSFFDKKGSVVAKGKQTPHLLNHEQRHFDLTRIYANLFYERLLQNKNLTEEKVKYIHGETVSEWQDIQDRYDLETEHSIDTVRQEAWNRRIDNMLKNFLWNKR